MGNHEWSQTLEVISAVLECLADRVHTAIQTRPISTTPSSLAACWTCLASFYVSRGMVTISILIGRHENSRVIFLSRDWSRYGHLGQRPAS
ncbi:hypothetical protein Hamer_G011211 [Homarus americanus]|uniref:Uncharacterized protein n=1 Tax=Homarus americanus TaxID=6706 RepID=A0A8J5K3H2_HOMAM|nr:hypothetical protein Hamer_G011211 [Homarus americanus]